MRIDLNCDMGEGAGFDDQLLPLVSSVNVACGFHAGDPTSLRETLRLARRHGVAVGAHPSYPDREGFGRNAMARSPEKVRDDVLYQVAALAGLCRAEAVALGHVKPHGALYNAAAQDRALAEALCEAVRSFDPALTVVCLAGSPMVEVVRAAGLACAEEAFADRAYTSRGALVPRSQPGAVIEEAARVAERVSLLARQGVVGSIDGKVVPVRADTLCVHGDTPGALGLLRAIRARLAADGVEVRCIEGRSGHRAP